MSGGSVAGRQAEDPRRVATEHRGDRVLSDVVTLEHRDGLVRGRSVVVRIARAPHAHLAVDLGHDPDAVLPRVGIIPEVYGQVGVWGSRYPHHDTSTPDEAVAMLERHGVAADTIAAMLGGNAARIFGLPTDS